MTGIPGIFLVGRTRLLCAGALLAVCHVRLCLSPTGISFQMSSFICTHCHLCSFLPHVSISMHIHIFYLSAHLFCFLFCPICSVFSELLVFCCQNLNCCNILIFLWGSIKYHLISLLVTFNVITFLLPVFWLWVIYTRVCTS